VNAFLQAGAADGSLRADLRAYDVVLSLLGIFLAGPSPDEAHRMLDLLVDGMVATR
jgi:hypothetical protein